MAVVEEAVRSLRGLPVAEAIVLLEQLATETKPGYRCRAIHRMPSISPERAEEFAIQMLNDPHPAVRWTACETLWDLGSERALPHIAEHLATDPDGFVRSFAAFTLGELGDESYLPILMDAVEHDTGTDHEGRPIRETASKAIRAIQARCAK